MLGFIEIHIKIGPKMSVLEIFFINSWNEVKSERGKDWVFLWYVEEIIFINIKDIL